MVRKGGIIHKRPEISGQWIKMISASIISFTSEMSMIAMYQRWYMLSSVCWAHSNQHVTVFPPLFLNGLVEKGIFPSNPSPEDMWLYFHLEGLLSEISLSFQWISGLTFTMVHGPTIAGISPCRESPLWFSSCYQYIYWRLSPLYSQWCWFQMPSSWLQGFLHHVLSIDELHSCKLTVCYCKWSLK